MIYLFNNQEELIRVVPKYAIKKLEQTEKLTDEHLIDNRITAEIKGLPDEVTEQVEYVAVATKGDRHTFDLYYVLSATTEHDITELYGVTSAVEELDKTIIEDQRPAQRGAREVIDRILEGTNWTTGYVADVGTRSTNFYFINALEALKKVCRVWGLEMRFYTEMRGNSIGNRYIEFKQKLGVNEGKRVAYGHNALEIIKEEERTQIYTALIGRGKGEQVSTEEENESGQAGYGRRITFEDIEWTEPVVKPLGQKYVELPEQTSTHGIKTPQGNRPKFGVVEFQDVEDKEQLLKLTYEKLVQLSRPLVTFRTSAVYLDANIADTVRVVRKDKGYDYDARVFEVVTDRLTDYIIDLKLGDQLTQSPGASRRSMASEVSSIIEGDIADSMLELVERLPSADGFTRNWYTDKEPLDPRVGDTWYKPDPDVEGGVIMLTWDGDQWVEIVRTHNWNMVTDLVGQAEENMKLLKDEILVSQEEADRALADFQTRLDQFELDLANIDFGNLDLGDLNFAEFLLNDLEFMTSFIDKLDIDQAIQDAGFGQALNDIRSKLEHTSDTLETTIELLGNDAHTAYNKNRATVTEGSIPYGEDGLVVGHNGDGFLIGRDYVVSFDATCIILPNGRIELVMQMPVIGPLSVVFQPTNGLPEFTVESAITEARTMLERVFNGTYQVIFTGDWYKTTTETRAIEGDEIIEKNIQFKEIADGNLTAQYEGIVDGAEYVLDGGVG